MDTFVHDKLSIPCDSFNPSKGYFIRPNQGRRAVNDIINSHKALHPHLRRDFHSPLAQSMTPVRFLPFSEAENRSARFNRRQQVREVAEAPFLTPRAKRHRNFADSRSSSMEEGMSRSLQAEMSVERDVARRRFAELTFDGFRAMEDENQRLKREIDELKTRVKDIGKDKEVKLQTAARTWRRWKDKAKAHMEAQPMDETFAKFGGLSRYNIASPLYHQHHPNAASVLFGFKSFSELCYYVFAHFDLKRPSLVIKDNSVQPHNLTDWEQVVLTKLFFHSINDKTRVALIYSTHQSSITRNVDKWLPHWEKYGERLSILPVPK